MAHFDYEKMKGYLDNDKIVLQSFLALLQQELPKSMAELEKHVADKNLEGIVNAAHKLKGTSLAAGLDELALIAIRLNKVAVLDEAVISGLVDELVKEIAIILPLAEAKSNELR